MKNPSALLELLSGAGHVRAAWGNSQSILPIISTLGSIQIDRLDLTNIMPVSLSAAQGGIVVEDRNKTVEATAKDVHGRYRHIQGEDRLL